MTVSTVVDHNDYTGNGVTTSFPYTFRIFKKSDLTVSVVDLAENISVLVLDTDYTVTNAGGYSGGNVVLSTPLTNGWQISIARELEPTQETDLRNQGKFFAEVHEDAFDKLTMLIQQAYSIFRLALRKPSSIANWYDAMGNYIRNLRDPRDAQDAATKNYVDTLASSNLSRTLRVPEQINQLPDAATRANKIPAFDSSGQAIVVSPPSGSATDVLLQLASYNPPGTNLIGTSGGVNLTQYLARTYIFLDDILPSKDGSSDCSAVLNAKLQSLSGAGVTFIGNRSSVYRFDDTVNFTGVSNTKLDFNFATVLDNVQGTIPESANRGKHTFLVYNASNVEIFRITYNKASTRSNSADTSIPTHIFWIGGQYLGSAMTRHISVHDIEVNASIFKGCVLAGVGELDGIDVRRINLNGGDWRFGCNFEYGEQPTDPAINPSMTNGRHPYNIYVEQFNGTNLPLCDGFLRVASCYNATFFNCNTFNVKSETYVYSGDRNISRFSQNVTFESCKFKHDGTTITAVNYQTSVLMVNKDGSTGDPLPSWTNYNHSILYKQCEFWNNSIVNSACVRFYGNKGATSFESCIFRNSYYGLNAGPSSNPDYVSVYGLSFKDCQFFNNYRDVYTLSTDGVLFDHCQFKDQVASSTLTPLFLAALSLNGVFRACSFTGLKRSTFYVVIQDNNSTNNKFEDCKFDMFTVNDSAISSAAIVFGSGNTSTGFLTPNTASQRGLIGESSSRIRDLSVFGGGFAHADVGEFFTSTTSYALTTIQGGINGMIITIRGASSGSSVTISHAASGVDTDKRILLLGKANKTVSGDGWSLRLMKLSNGWWEI